MERRNKMAQRRYKIGKHPEYDRFYDKLTMRSPILNQDARNRSIDYSGYDFSNKSDLLKIKRLLTQKHENRDRQLVPGKIPGLEKQLEEVEQSFKNLRQRLINEGKSPANNMPKDMQDKKYETEARFDVAKAELELIDKQLKAVKKVEDAKHKEEVLKFGCQGSSKLSNGIIAEVDFQRVKLVDDVPTIVDEFSPYNGMRTADYFSHVVAPWNKLRKELPDRLKLAKRLRSEGVKDFNLEEEYNKRIKDKLQKHGKHLLDIEIKPNLHVPSWPDGVKKIEDK